MAYIDELLGRGEQVLYEGRQHTFVLISNILAELFLIAVLVAAGVVSRRAFRDPLQQIRGVPVGQLILLICTVISVLIVISALVDYLRWNNEEYIVTDQRVIQVRGIINKQVIDSSLEKINDVGMTQSWIGRIFDFGDIDILTASDVGVNTLRKLAHPLEFKRAMLEAKQAHNRGYGYLDPQSVAAYTQPAAAQAPSVEQMLRQLAELRDQGVLSQAEFDSKKRDLLSRM